MKTFIFVISLFICLLTASSAFSQTSSFRFDKGEGSRWGDLLGADLLKKDGKIETAATQNVKLNSSGFATQDYVRMLHIKREIEEKENSIWKNLQEQTSVADYKGKVRYNKRDSLITALKREVVILKSEVDSLYDNYIYDYLSVAKWHGRFGISKARAFYRAVYGSNDSKFSALSSSGIGLGQSTSSIFSELVSGNFGLIRASIGAMITGNSNEDLEEARSQEAFQRLATYGGNTVMNLEYPLFYGHDGRTFVSFIRLNAKAAADIPEFGKTVDKFAGSGAIGFDGYLHVGTSKGEIRAFLTLAGNYFFGTSVFKENLGVSKSTFPFLQTGVGVVIQDKIKIELKLFSLSTERELNKTFMLGGGQFIK